MVRKLTNERQAEHHGGMIKQASKHTHTRVGPVLFSCGVDVGCRRGCSLSQTDERGRQQTVGREVLVLSFGATVCWSFSFSVVVSLKSKYIQEGLLFSRANAEHLFLFLPFLSLSLSSLLLPLLCSSIASPVFTFRSI